MFHVPECLSRTCVLRRLFLINNSVTEDWFSFTEIHKHYSVLLYQIFMYLVLFSESIGYINEKRCHSDVSTIRVSEKNGSAGSVHSHLCTDTDTWKQRHGHWLGHFLFITSFMDTDTGEIKRCGTQLSNIIFILFLILQSEIISPNNIRSRHKVRPNDRLFLLMLRTETDRNASYIEKVHLA